jgi:hypothetical protein
MVSHVDRVVERAPICVVLLESFGAAFATFGAPNVGVPFGGVNAIS